MTEEETKHLDLVLDDSEEQDWMRPLPYALAKAIGDSFQYALMLRDGTIIEFESATPPSTGWIMLHGPKIVNRGYDACFDRGMEVRLEEIVWVADAPHGS
ncbi:MAG: hypothetical protein M1541_00965 [Acidobacteria bacterium]|nr:hypothetical protein [Acidobacteriota bacterium]